MSTNLQSESHEISHGDINFQQIDQYLSITDSSEIARLAALMAPKFDSFTPEVLIDAALALQEEAEQGLIRKRLKVLSKMNRETILELASQLDVLNKSLALENDPVLKDTVKGPVVKLLVKINPFNSHLCPQDQKNKIDEYLKKADSRTSLPRPSLPCNLEEALRYSIDAPTEPWPLLERAFIDFLGIDRNESQIKRDQEEFDYAKQAYEREEKVIIALRNTTANNPQGLSYQKQREDELRKLFVTLQEIEYNLKYRTSFSPNSDTPEEIEQNAVETYRAYWKSRKSDMPLENLYFLATDFYAFWKTHSKTYLKKYAEAEKKKRQTRKVKKEVGYIGSEVKASNVWIGHSKSFSEFRIKENCNPESDDIASVIKSFVEKESRLKTKDAKKKLSEFLLTLTNKKNLHKSALELLPLIINMRSNTRKNLGIKSMTEHPLRECQIIINGGLQDFRKKL